ncbi:MAG: TetR/AcrR family transcriptional regulator [Pseudomonadota bacterium]
MSESSPTNWIEPAQKRSRDKVARILAAARDLTVETGSANLKMTEVSKRAGVAVGTLYQFFPSAPSLIERLFAQEMETIDASFAQVLERADSWHSLLEGVGDLLEAQFETVRSNPALLILLGASGLHADIQKADLENTRRNAAALSAKIAEIAERPVAGERIETLSMLICHLWGGVIRLALLDDAHDPKRYLEHYHGMLSSYARELR